MDTEQPQATLTNDPERVKQAALLHARTCLAIHDRYPLLALARAHHRNRRGQPISFTDKPFLIPLYAMAPHAPEMVFAKAVQTGISEMLIQLMLYNAGWRDRICAYVLPQYKTSERFVDERLNPLLVEVPAYEARTPGEAFGTAATKSKGNLKRKRFGRLGSLLFLGSNTPADFVEFSADTAIIDEYDECEPENVGKLIDRVRESAYPQVFSVANPRLPGQGIHRMWKQGDRSRWFQRCTACGERQPLVWEEHVVRRTDNGMWVPRDTARANAPELGDIRPVCRRCKRPWDREAQGGVWVAEAPGHTPSFHMSRLDVLDPQPFRRLYAEWVKAQGNTIAMSNFHTGVLGRPYEPAGSRVTQEMLELAMHDQPPIDHHPQPEKYKANTLVMGVDVGAVLNVSISILLSDEKSPTGYRRRGVYVCAVPQFEDLYDLIDAFAVDVCVIDAMPETRKAKEVRDHYTDEGTCEVWLCRFHPQPKVGAETFGLKLDYDEKVVTVDRTQVMDATMDEIAARLKTFPSDASTVLGFTDQMKAPVRQLDPDAQRIVWSEGNDPDHFRFADVYERVAQEVHDRSGGYFE